LLIFENLKNSSHAIQEVDNIDVNQNRNARNVQTKLNRKKGNKNISFAPRLFGMLFFIIIIFFIVKAKTTSIQRSTVGARWRSSRRTEDVEEPSLAAISSSFGRQGTYTEM